MADKYQYNGSTTTARYLRAILANPIAQTAREDAMPSARSTRNLRHGSKRSMRIEKNTTALMDGAQARSREPNGAMPLRRATEDTTSEVDGMEIICPVCGSDAASHFYRHGNDIVGCDCCVVIMELYEVGEDDAL